MSLDVDVKIVSSSTICVSIKELIQLLKGEGVPIPNNVEANVLKVCDDENDNHATPLSEKDLIELSWRSEEAKVLSPVLEGPPPV